jgi:uncharacterized protein YdaU (DUF1376 family)
MHYYKKNIGDYAKKTGRLSMLQHGAYTLLIDSCYDRERFPTLEDAIEWTWASSTEELEAVKFVLTRFFTLEDGVYVQSRIKEEIAEYHSKSETNKRIAVEREAKRKEKSTTRARTVDDSTKAGDEAPPNHKPGTTNQEPEEETNVSVGKADRLPACDRQAVVDLYHEVLPELPRVRVMNDSRGRIITSRWRWILTSKKSDGTRRAETPEEAMAWLRQFFEFARQNDFIMGKGYRDPKHSNWQADIEYLLSDRGLKQVVEKTGGSE